LLWFEANKDIKLLAPQVIEDDTESISSGYSAPQWVSKAQEQQCWWQTEEGYTVFNK
jgi:hypothetical protein